MAMRHTKEAPGYILCESGLMLLDAPANLPLPATRPMTWDRWLKHLEVPKSSLAA